jgi:tetratricopeptide (TPR) repeat protein
MSSAFGVRSARAAQTVDAVTSWIEERSPIRAHSFVMGLFFCTAVVIAYGLLPGDSERIAMLERDGKTSEARQILEASFKNGDRRQRTLFLLQSLYETSGDVPKSLQMLELLAESRPRDVAVQRQLGLFYKQTQDEKGYVRSLLQQIELRYSETACRDAIGLLRRSGAYSEEQAVLQKCRQKGYRNPADMVRLASLLAADGDVKEASILLRAVDDLRRLKTERERLQLFELLIEHDQPNEAQRRAVRWVKGAKDDALALTLIHSLVVANRHDLAIELARETSIPGDSVFLAVAEVMVERSEKTAAQAILRGWLEKATVIEPAVAARFITAALNADTPDLALTGAQRIGLAKLPVETVTDLARALDAVGRRVDADALRAGLTREPGSDAQPRPPSRDRSRMSQGFKIVGLDGWRSTLWKRLSEENKPVVLVQAPTGLRAVKTTKDLKALKQNRKATTIRRRFKAAPKQPDNGPINFFNLKPPG